MESQDLPCNSSPVLVTQFFPSQLGSDSVMCLCVMLQEMKPSMLTRSDLHESFQVITTLDLSTYFLGYFVKVRV